MIPLDAPAMDAQLRDAVAAAVEGSSLRGVARDVGLSPTGLGKFLAGSRPYPSTRRKLQRWMAAHRVDLRGGQAMHVLRVLLQDLPPAAQPAAEDRMLAALEAVYAASLAGLPEWLRTLRSHPAR